MGEALVLAGIIQDQLANQFVLHVIWAIQHVVGDAALEAEEPVERLFK